MLRTRLKPTPPTLETPLEEQEGSEILAESASLCDQLSTGQQAPDKPPWVALPSAPDAQPKGMGGRPRTKNKREGRDLSRGGVLKPMQQTARHRACITVLTKRSDRAQTLQPNTACRLCHGWGQLKLHSANPDLMGDDKLYRGEVGQPSTWASIAQTFCEGPGTFEGAWEEAADLSAPGNTRTALSHCFRLPPPLCRGVDAPEECLHWKEVGEKPRAALLSGGNITRSGPLPRRGCRRVLSCQVRNPPHEGCE